MKTPEPNLSPKEPNLSANLQGHIGNHLRAAYESLVKEPVPDKILNVLKDLEAEEKKGSQS